jgi:Asp-tRNA(Asn)/Glu-tRNA(Gln) amidotransferase A subunit family amidase
MQSMSRFLFLVAEGTQMEHLGIVEGGSRDAAAMNWPDERLPGPATELAQAHKALEQLENRFAQREPSVRAFLLEPGRFARLRREAEEAFAAHPDPRSRGPLFGVPIGVKDVFHVDGLPTRAGSRLPPEELAGPQAGAVARLRTEGALIAGKTVTTEFAYYAAGPTRNPHNPQHTPGGSSSGSAAAVAAGLCPAALGTQTIGSILRPASYCGVVGFKPSFGRVPAEGLIHLAPSLDHVGFLTVDVAVASALAAVLLKDYDPARAGHSRQPVLGIPEGPYLSHASAEGLAYFRAVCERLAARYEVRPVPAMPDFNRVVARHYRLMAAEASEVHADWFRRFPELYAAQTAELIQRGREIATQQTTQDRAGCQALRGELTELMDKHGIDVWISPSAPGAAPRRFTGTGDPVMNLPWTHAGLPALGVPAGHNAEGLPMGLQLAGRWLADEELLSFGQEIARVVAPPN